MYKPSCLYSQPQRITALWPVLISRPTEGRRLSWPGWLVTYRNGMPAWRRSRIPVPAQFCCGDVNAPLKMPSLRAVSYRRVIHACLRDDWWWVTHHQVKGVDGIFLKGGGHSRGSMLAAFRQRSARDRKRLMIYRNAEYLNTFVKHLLRRWNDGYTCAWLLMFAPFSTSSRTTVSWPASDATCRGSLPLCYHTHTHTNDRCPSDLSK